MEAISCSLVCVNNSHPPIPLPHHESVIIGRSPKTLIRDTRCSKKQVELIADLENLIVVVKQIGSNASSIERNEIGKNQSGHLTEKDSLYVLKDQYPHNVVFKFKEGGKSAVETNSTNLNAGRSKGRGKISDFFTGKSNAPSGKLKRKLCDSDSEGNGGEKRLKTDEGSDSDDEAHRAFVAVQMIIMKEMAKSDPPDKKERTEQTSFSQKMGEPCKTSHWESHDNKLLMYMSKGVKASSKIAGFDIDGTIICTQSGKTFPTNSKDWKIMHIESIKMLKKLIEGNYKVVFFTNQLGIGRGRQDESEFKKKVESILERIGIPVQVFIAKYADIYRKPAPGMWNHLQDKANDGIKIDVERSLYVGDAAGRPVNWAPKKKKDFSSSDRLFALNLRLPFYTPEEYFLKHKRAPFNMPEFDPRKLSSNAPLTSSDSTIAASHQELIINVGSPASGKSFFCQEYLIPKGYVCVNRDMLKTWQKCAAKCQEALSGGHSVVIDNTNPDPESRSRYLNVAKKMKIPCRCFLFTTSHFHCRHNEKFREMTDSSHEAIKEMILNMYKSKFVIPSLSEGFTEVVNINFVPKFKDKKLETFYRHFLLEK